MKMRSQNNVSNTLFYVFKVVMFLLVILDYNTTYSQTRSTTLVEKTVASNPFDDSADIIDTCFDDGSQMPKFFLCGADASRKITINFTNVLAIYWEKLNEGSCTAVANSSCPNKNNSCSWTQVESGSNFIVKTAGQYKIRVIYLNNTQNTFYFNVYSNSLDIPVYAPDLYCGKPTEITVAKLTGYEYSLDGITYQSSNIFPVSSAGEYKVRVRRVGATSKDCVFELSKTIANKDLTVTPLPTQPISATQLGSIKLTANNVRAQYYYKITQGTTIIDQKGPVLQNEYTFPNLNSGTYTWSVKTEDCDWKSGDLTLNYISPFQISKNVKAVSCQPGSVEVSVSGGKAPYKYYFNGKTTPEASNLISVPVAGTYTIKVVDSNNQNDTITVEVPLQAAPVYTIEKTNENCYYPNSWQIKFNVTNSNGNSLRYSIDNGVTFSTNPLFQSLYATPAGTVFKTIIEYTYDGVKCTKTEDVTITQPQFGLSATAGVSELIGCQSSPDEDKALIRITNPQGGTPPYMYSYDGKSTWSTATSSLQPPGEYVFYIRDTSGCVSAMSKVIVENIGVPSITVTNDSFNCDGSSNNTVSSTTNTSTKFNYSYSLDGGPFQASSNFSNISPGSHSLVVKYEPLIVATFSNLLKEDFGYGPDTTSPGMSSAYCFEKQVLPLTCNTQFGWGLNINDGEYAVTSKIQYPYGAWYAASDHSDPTIPKGRFLVVNIKGDNTRPIIYEKTINDIIPNQPINVEFYVTNLLRIGNTQFNSNLRIALVNTAGTEIDFFNTGLIPKTERWEKYSTKLNPGNNTTLKFQVRSIEQNQSGNDVAIDDISAYQIPKLCTATRVVNFTVPSGNAFEATVTGTNNSSCAGLSDGVITIAVKNFNPTTGYLYSIDNGSSWKTATTSPFKITNLGAGSFNLKVSYSLSSTGLCVKSFSPITIIVPKPLVTTATVTTLASCSRGATITASSTEGTPFYKYELWNEFNTTNIRPIQNSGVFENVPPGKYTIRGLDANDCSSASPFSITVANPLQPVASLKSNSDLCYDTVNQAQIEINVSSGTAPFSYSLNDAPAQTSNIFTNIGPGEYKVKVVDSNQCESLVTQKVIIGEEIKVSAILSKDLDCTSSPDAIINVTLAGGVKPLRYQIKKGNVVISPLDIAIPEGNTSFNYTVTEANAASYSFTIIDGNGCSKTSLPITVIPKVNPKIDSLSQIQSILCYGQSTAAIKVNLDTSKGVAPFTYEVKEISFFPHLVYGNQLTDLPVGNYEVTVTDSKSCKHKMTIPISQPPKIILNWDKNDISCNGATGVSKGSVIVKSVTGGKAPYNYFVTGVNGYNNFELNNSGTLSHTFDVVDFGLYQINIVDANGCSVLQQNVLVASPPEDLDINVTALPTICASGGSCIVAVADPNGFSSSGPFYFAVYKPGLVYDSTNPAWQIGDASKKTTFTGLIPGVKYTFIVYDSVTKCYKFKTAESSVSTNSTLGISDLSSKDITCKGSADGKVSFTIKNNYSVATSVSYQIYNSLSLIPVTGVTGTTSIPANGEITISDLGSLPFGNYFVLLKEGIGAPNEGCSIASETFNITESAKDLDFSPKVLKNVNCNEYGVINLEAKDGKSPYQYQISAVSSPTSSIVSAGALSSPSSPSGFWDSFNTLTVNQGGSYTVSVQDAYGCVKSKSVTIVKDSEPKISLSVPNLCIINEGAFEINLTKTTDGIAPYYISVNDGVFTPVTFPQTFLNQNSGDYKITVKDVNGCTDTQNKTIYSPLGLSSEVIQLESCNANDGKIDAVSVGGSGNFEYKIDSGTYADSPNFSGLSSGNHNLYIRDKTTACEKNITVNLEPPTPVTGLSLSPGKSISCYGRNDGSIIASISTPANGINNNPVYKYSLNGGSPQESNIFSGLATGNYTVEVSSGRGCKSPTLSILVDEPKIITVPNPTVVEFGCSTANNWSNASITVSGVTGGSNTYTQYEFIKNGIRVQFGPSSAYMESDLSGGSYTINIYDDKGCSGSTSAVINPFYTLDKISVVPTSPISCLANETIQVSVSAIGGVSSPLIFSISPLSGSLLASTIPTNSTGIFSGLTVGEYLITARNTATNCSISEVYTVNEPNTFDLTINSVAPVTCFGGSNGNINISLSDRNTISRAGAFSYIIKDSLGNPAYSSVSASAGPVLISNLKEGIYTITVSLSKAPFCSLTEKFTITGPESQLTLNESHSDISCVLGNNDGKITALTTGGWTDFYEYKWQKDGILIEDWGEVSNLTGLTKGNYQVSVRDAKGCSVQKPVILNNPTPISFTPSTDTPLLSCYGDRTATIATTTVSGGQGSNYWYTLNKIGSNTVSFGPQASNEFKNLGVGNYTLKVNDNWSCETTSAEIKIIEPTNVVATLALKTPPTCANSAILDLQTTGGTPPYLYGTDGTNFSSVLPNPLVGRIGVNHFFVKDKNGCGNYVSNDVLVDPPKGLTVSLDTTFAQVNCAGDSTASILARAQGGLGNYSYILVDNIDVPIGLANLTGVFSNLKGGNYKVKVTSGDCAAVYSKVVNIVEPTAKLNSDPFSTPVLCAGSYDGTITVNTSGGTVAINYAISPNLSQFTESNVFKNLAVGTYEIIIQDALGCYEKKPATVSGPDPIVASTLASPPIVQELCFNDKNAQFSIALSGGKAPYSISLDSPTGPFTTAPLTQTQFDFKDLIGGEHTVYVQDANNCSFTWKVDLEDSVKLNPIPTVNYSCVNNAQYNLVTVNLDPSITNPDLVQFALDGGMYQSSSILLSNMSPGDHFIRVKHNNGCIKETPVFTILKIDPLTLSLKEGGLNEIIAVANGGAGNYNFTFGGEFNGSNPNYIYYKTQDFLVSVQEANGCTASVTQRFDHIDICVPSYFTPNGDGNYDTWAPGCTVNYKNLTYTIIDRYGREIQSFKYGDSWDGKYNGIELPSGDYWYVLKLNNSKDEREFVGHFTLYR